MKRKNIVFIPIIACLSALLCTGSVSGQKKVKNPVSIEVVDQSGNPVAYASVMSSAGRSSYTTGNDGKLLLNLVAGDMVKVTAEGYGSVAESTLSAENGVLKVTIDKLPARTDDQSMITTVTGSQISERRSVGAFSKVSGRDLEANPTVFLWDALGGRLNGLFLTSTSHVPGFSTNSGFVRAPNGGGPVVMIDGVMRSLEYIEPETIENVYLLKDASLKSLLGGIHTNGILMVTTRRGKPYENSVRVNVQSGIQSPTRMPEYLNSYDYATLYNQALQHVGLPAKYNPADYLGGDPILYPDVDYYKTFLNDNMTITRANAQMSGGTDKTRYFVHMSYQTNGGLEKFTEYPNNDEVISVRGNIDNTIYDFITLKAGLSASIQNKHWPNISTQNFFNALSNTRPNEFPIQIPGSMAGSSKEYVLGGTASNRDNPLGLLTQGGYVKRFYNYVQSDFTFDINFDRWVKGLRVRPEVTFDVYNEFSSRKDGQFSVFEPVADPSGTTFLNWGFDELKSAEVRGQVSNRRNWVFSTTVEYNRNFGKHDLSVLANYYMQQNVYSTLIYSLRRMNIGAMANYMYDNRLVADVSLNYVGVPSFAPKERFGLFPTVGAAWILSEESFMRNAYWLDYFKLRASYGVLGSTNYNNLGFVSAYYYRDEWSTNGTYQLTGFQNIVTLAQTGSPLLGFQKSHEFNVGFDFAVLCNDLSGSLGYFRNKLEGGIVNLGSITPGVSGKGSALKWHNYNEYLSQGFEAELAYRKRLGEVNLLVGGNVSYGYSKVVRTAEPDYPDELAGLRSVKTLGEVKGYQVIGTFADQADIASSPVQTFGSVLPGDLKYRDANGDGTVDERDQAVIANNQPTVQYGITVKVAYKGFNLDLLGYGLGGFDEMLTNSYYQIYGERKYSNVLNKGLPNGNPHPVLRANESQNNFVNSDYWRVDGGFFKLRNVELGYTLPKNTSEKIGMNTFKVFVRGYNLLTISKIDDLDPESLSAGVSNFPLFTTITGGLSFSF